MIFKDYYKILGLESPKATIDDIKTAYREQAKKYHPDVNVGNKNAEERFKDINEAYKTLTNQATKRKYDRMWNAHIGRRKNKAKQNKEQKTTRQELLSVLFGLNTKKEEKDSENSKRKQKKQPSKFHKDNAEHVQQYAGSGCHLRRKTKIKKKKKKKKKF